MATQKIPRFPLDKADPRGTGIHWPKGRQDRKKSLRGKVTARYSDGIEGIKRELRQKS